LLDADTWNINVESSGVQSVYDTDFKKLTFTVPAGLYLLNLTTRTYNVTSGTYPEGLDTYLDTDSGDPFMSWTSRGAYAWSSCSCVIYLNSGTHYIIVKRSTRGGSFNVRGGITRL
jgi:hypothetical protein